MLPKVNTKYISIALAIKDAWGILSSLKAFIF